MWNFTILTRHENGCTLIRKDGPGFEKEGAVRWAVLCGIQDACNDLDDGMTLSLAYSVWWAQNPEKFYLTVPQAEATFVVYAYSGDAGQEDAAVGALRVMFEELGADVDFRRIKRAA
jgi:hypothetical protein